MSLKEAILENIKSGSRDVEALAVQMDTTPTIVRRLLSRLKNEGKRLGKIAGWNTEALPESEEVIEEGPTLEDAPPPVGEQGYVPSNEEIAGHPMFQTSINAIRADLIALKQGELRIVECPEIDPMLMLAITTEFVKAVGGRIAAHHLIEQVYAAYKAAAHEQKLVPGNPQDHWSRGSYN